MKKALLTVSLMTCFLFENALAAPGDAGGPNSKLTISQLVDGKATAISFLDLNSAQKFAKNHDLPLSVIDQKSKRDFEISTADILSVKK